MEPMTIEQFKEALPDKIRKSINQTLINQINQTLSDPDLYEQYRDNLLSYGKVLVEGKFKISQYIDAVRYVSHKVAGDVNIKAFAKTFPDKMVDWAARGVMPKDQASYVTAYNKSKLVNLLMEQVMVPTWVLNQDMFQKALNVQYELMTDTEVSAKVRSDAADSLLNHLKPPEVAKIELDIGVKTGSPLDALRQATWDLVAQQRQQIISGQMSAQQIAHIPIVIDAEVIE
jgi:hypothetical protein